MSTSWARLASRIVAARRARGWTQAELGRRVGASQSTVARVESGTATRIDLLAAVCRELGGELVIDARLPHPGEPVRQTDRGHAPCIGAIRALLVTTGHVCASEVGIVDGAWRGWIDLVAHDAATRRIVIVEVQTELRDVGSLERQVDRYVRMAPAIARDQGWAISEVAVLVALLATTANDGIVVANRAELGAAFPVRGRAAMACLLDRQPVRGRMLLMIDPRRRGRRRLQRTTADGRRTPAPYRDYREFVATLRG